MAMKKARRLQRAEASCNYQCYCTFTGSLKERRYTRVHIIRNDNANIYASMLPANS